MQFQAGSEAKTGKEGEEEYGKENRRRMGLRRKGIG
jgi:hypothetical protein